MTVVVAVAAVVGGCRGSCSFFNDFMKQCSQSFSTMKTNQLSRKWNPCRAGKPQRHR